MRSSLETSKGRRAAYKLDDALMRHTQGADDSP
jgi:hypothetical protein